LDGALQKRYFDLNQTYVKTGNINGWGGYLIGTLGRGGNGIYMLDVTNQTTPFLLWYKEHLGDQFLSMVASASEPTVTNVKNIPKAEAPFLKLGYNSPKPGLGVIKLPNTNANKYQNFIALPGGLMTNVVLKGGNGQEGSTLLLLDPRDGSINMSYDSAAIANGWKLGNGDGNAPYMGMLVSEPSMLRSTLSPYLTRAIITADNRGNIFRLSFSDDTNGETPLANSKWNIKTIATLQPQIDVQKGISCYANPYGFAMAMMPSGLWIAGGTADIAARNDGGEGYSIQNNKQMIFSFNNGNDQKAPYIRDRDWKKLVAESVIANDPNLSIKDTDVNAAGKPYTGWYLELEKGDGFNVMDEYVSANPLAVNGTLYVATFIGEKIDTNTVSQCGGANVTGSSRIYAMDITTGAQNDTWNGRGKYITVDGVKITGLTRSNDRNHDRVLVTYTKLADDTNLDTMKEDHVTHVNADGLDMLVIEKPVKSGRLNIDQNDQILMYWAPRGDLGKQYRKK
jgi:Tfp pilus tip-associated adhesin PilY1